MDKIMKFSILDRKTEFTILDGIWTKNGQMATDPQKKLSNSFTFIEFTMTFLWLV